MKLRPTSKQYAAACAERDKLAGALLRAVLKLSELGYAMTADGSWVQVEIPKPKHRDTIVTPGVFERLLARTGLTEEQFRELQERDREAAREDDRIHLERQRAERRAELEARFHELSVIGGVSRMPDADLSDLIEDLEELTRRRMTLMSRSRP